jgi:putative RecB family exonuclease
MERYSYSKLEVSDQCPLRYKFTYIDGKRSEESTLPLEIGGLTHKGKELWGEAFKKNEEPDFDYINNVILNGIEVQEIVNINGKEVKNEIVENLLGIKDLKSKYFESYMEPCNKSGMNYDEKMKIYFNTLYTEDLKDSDWQILAIEDNFQFVYEDRCVLHGFIDRIDVNKNRDLRVVDYKTSKEIYKNEKLATPLQFYIYGLACEKIYKKLPIEYWYEFIFLGEKQQGCTKGYYERGKKKLNSLLDKVDKYTETGEYIPKPSPLCFWCPYSNNTCAKDKELNGMCEYFSLWTPMNKNFGVNKKWNDFNNKIEEDKNIKDVVVKKEFVW